MWIFDLFKSGQLSSRSRGIETSMTLPILSGNQSIYNLEPSELRIMISICVTAESEEIPVAYFSMDSTTSTFAVPWSEYRSR
jgi:hypothetical protein